MASVLRQWLKIAGVNDGDDAAWEALKKEVAKRLDPRALDDAASAESPGDRLILAMPQFKRARGRMAKSGRSYLLELPELE